jgi:hypothetical protein
MKTYICTEEDLPEILELHNKHRYTYGVDIDLARIKNHQINIIKEAILEKTEDTYVIAVRNNDKLMSFCVMKLWKSMPVWSPVFLYEDADQLFSKRIQQPLHFSLSMQKCIEIAESKQRFTGFLVTRYSKTWKRIQETMKESFPDYTVSEVEILGPGEKTKYVGFERLLGDMNGLQEKTIVVLQFSKLAVLYT